MSDREIVTMSICFIFALIVLMQLETCALKDRCLQAVKSMECLK